MSLHQSSPLSLHTAIEPSSPLPEVSVTRARVHRWGGNLTILAWIVNVASWVVVGAVGLTVLLVAGLVNDTGSALSKFLIDLRWVPMLDLTVISFATGLVLALLGWCALPDSRRGWAEVAVVLSATGMAAMLLI